MGNLVNTTITAKDISPEDEAKFREILAERDKAYEKAFKDIVAKADKDCAKEFGALRSILGECEYLNLQREFRRAAVDVLAKQLGFRRAANGQLVKTEHYGQ